MTDPTSPSVDALTKDAQNPRIPLGLRQHAIRQLGETGDPTALAPLLALLESPYASPSFREEAVWAIAAIADQAPHAVAAQLARLVPCMAGEIQQRAAHFLRGGYLHILTTLGRDAAPAHAVVLAVSTDPGVGPGHRAAAQAILSVCALVPPTPADAPTPSAPPRTPRAPLTP